MVHFVLVHGIAHGAWCWYKVKQVLESEGHQVTALDLAASGINVTKIEEVNTMSDYTKPLIEWMDSLPPGEKVILVGHGLGGINLGIAMDSFPEKISAAVFLTAFMPDCTHKSSYALEKYFLERPPWGTILDSGWNINLDSMTQTFTLGPDYLANYFYQCCPPEDQTLATMLVRPTNNLALDYTYDETMLSQEKFGSVDRFYIICDQDKVLQEDFQRWMTEENPTEEVKVIKGADHMAMLSKPRELCLYLKEIADKY